MSSGDVNELEQIIKGILEFSLDDFKKLNALSFEKANEIKILQDILLRKNIKESATLQFIKKLNTICKANIGLAHEFKDLTNEFKYSKIMSERVKTAIDIHNIYLMRNIRGDGNCCYRTIIFLFFELLFYKNLIPEFCQFLIALIETPARSIYSLSSSEIGQKIILLIENRLKFINLSFKSLNNKIDALYLNFVLDSDFDRCSVRLLRIMNYTIIYANQDLNLEGLGVIDLIKQTNINEKASDKNSNHSSTSINPNNPSNQNLLTPNQMIQINHDKDKDKGNDIGMEILTVLQEETQRNQEAGINKEVQGKLEKMFIKDNTEGDIISLILSSLFLGIKLKVISIDVQNSNDLYIQENKSSLPNLKFPLKSGTLDSLLDEELVALLKPGHYDILYSKNQINIDLLHIILEQAKKFNFFEILYQVNLENKAREESNAFTFNPLNIQNAGQSNNNSGNSVIPQIHEQKSKEVILKCQNKPINMQILSDFLLSMHSYESIKNKSQNEILLQCPLCLKMHEYTFWVNVIGIEEFQKVIDKISNQGKNSSVANASPKFSKFTKDSLNEDINFVNTEISHECIKKSIPMQIYIEGILEKLIPETYKIDKLDIPDFIICKFCNKSISRYDLQNMIGEEKYKELVLNYLKSLLEKNVIYHSHHIFPKDKSMRSLKENNKKMFFSYNIYSKESFQCFDDKCKFKISKKELINFLGIQIYNEMCKEIDLFLNSTPRFEVRWHCKLIYKECYSYALQEFIEFNLNQKNKLKKNKNLICPFCYQELEIYILDKWLNKTDIEKVLSLIEFNKELPKTEPNYLLPSYNNQKQNQSNNNYETKEWQLDWIPSQEPSNPLSQKQIKLHCINSQVKEEEYINKMYNANKTNLSHACKPDSILLCPFCNGNSSDHSIQSLSNYYGQELISKILIKGGISFQSIQPYLYGDSRQNAINYYPSNQQDFIFHNNPSKLNDRQDLREKAKEYIIKNGFSFFQNQNIIPDQNYPCFICNQQIKGINYMDLFNTEELFQIKKRIF